MLTPALASERVLVYQARFVGDDPGTPAVDEEFDEMGNPVVTTEPELPATEGELVSAAVRPVAATEDELSRDTRITKYQVYLPPHVELNALARLEWRGRMHEVIGEPEVVKGLGGRGSHLRVLVREVLG